jgi:hypothetical protein
MEAIADVEEALKNGTSKLIPLGVLQLEGGSGGRVAKGGKEMLGSLVGNMIAEDKRGVVFPINADESLVRLDLPEGTSR